MAVNFFDPPTPWNFTPADFVPFKDRELCERLRKISGKDLEKHEFDLCEECYDRITASFAVPPKISEDMEG